jgi:tripartite motif-containing protein 71
MSKHLVNLCFIAAVAMLFAPPTSRAEAPPPFLLTWGSNGVGAGQFIFPDGVAVDNSGHVYVIDLAGFVQKFSPTGTFLTMWGSDGTGDGQFRGAPGIAVDDSNNVYVADMGNHRIQKFTSDGVFLMAWGTRGAGDGELNYPFDIAFGPDGYLYVSDQGNCRIQVFTTMGAYVRQWGSCGFGDGQFYQPYGVGIDRHTGEVYVTENNATNTVRVQKFTSGGAFLTKWGSGGSGDGQFSHPMKVTVDDAGNVFVTDKDNNRVQKFISNGSFLTKWGSLGSGDGQFNLPYGIAIHTPYIYVTDHYNHRVQVFGLGPTAARPVSWGALKTRYR